MTCPTPLPRSLGPPAWLALLLAGLAGCKATFVKVSVDFVPAGGALASQVTSLLVVAFDDVSRVDAGPTAVPSTPLPGGLGPRPTFSVQAPTGATVTVLVSGLDDGGTIVGSGFAVTPSPLQAGTNALTVFLTPHCNGSTDCTADNICSGLEVCALGYGPAFGACQATGAGDGGRNAAVGTRCGRFGKCDGQGACLGPSCGDGTLDPGEQCDEGARNSDTSPDQCRTNCLLPHCGDGVTDPDAGEICDLDAGHNGTGEGCNATCNLKGLVTTLAGHGGQSGLVDGPGGLARFSQPYGLALLDRGLYVVDTGFRAIRRVDLVTGEVVTVAGGNRTAVTNCNDADGRPPDAGLCDPLAILAWDGGLLISDDAALRFLALSPTLDGGVLSTFGGQLAKNGVGVIAFTPGPLLGGSSQPACEFGAPHGLTAAAGALFSNTFVAGAIGRVDLRSQQLASVWEFSGSIVHQGGMTTLGGLVYTTDVASSGALYSLDPADLDAGLKILAISTLGSPDGVCTDGASLYVVSSGYNQILQVDPDGGAISLVAGGLMQPNVTEADGLGKNAAFFVPQSCIYDSLTRALYVADNSGNTIRKIQ